MGASDSPTLLVIVERVKNGLKAARARGKHIGREKKRDSEMIRKLRKAGLTYRAIATIAKCSHGSVHAELLAEKKEEQQKKEQMLLAQEEQKKQIAYFKGNIRNVEEISVEPVQVRGQNPPLALPSPSLSEALQTSTEPPPQKAA